MELCQRPMFFENETIDQEEDHFYEYKFFAMNTVNASLNEFNLLRTICGMLNCFGGYVFIGIKEDQSNNDIKRFAIGYYLSEMDKE